MRGLDPRGNRVACCGCFWQGFAAQLLSGFLIVCCEGSWPSYCTERTKVYISNPCSFIFNIGSVLTIATWTTEPVASMSFVWVWEPPGEEPL